MVESSRAGSRRWAALGGARRRAAAFADRRELDTDLLHEND